MDPKIGPAKDAQHALQEASHNRFQTLKIVQLVLPPWGVGGVGEHPSYHTDLFIVAQSLGLLFGPAVQLIRGPNALDSLSRGETILTRGDVATSGRRVHHSVGQHKTIKTTINEHL